ncbi:MAG TPA: phosphoribosyltransferase family protein [Clostridia bacterium]|nr:phosphoribosyltransferase family protein [Clostridia bacterium]
MYYPITIAGLERNLPLCKLNDELYIAAFVIFGDAPLTVACAKELIEKTAEFRYDYVITAEAKGIPLAHEMARQREDETYFVARKVPKLYMTGVFEVSVQSITTAKEQKLFLDTAEAEKMRGKRILIVDDVISTGESLKAVEVLVNKAGGIIAGKAAILAEGDAAKRNDITFLQGLPLFNIDGNPI